MFFDIEFQVWNSMTFICAALVSAFTVSISSSGSCLGHSDASSCLTLAMPMPACFWKNSWPFHAEGPLTSEQGRPLRCGRIQSLTDS